MHHSASATRVLFIIILSPLLFYDLFMRPLIVLFITLYIMHAPGMYIGRYNQIRCNREWAKWALLPVVMFMSKHVRDWQTRCNEYVLLNIQPSAVMMISMHKLSFIYMQQWWHHGAGISPTYTPSIAANWVSWGLNLHIENLIKYRSNDPILCYRCV